MVISCRFPPGNFFPCKIILFFTNSPSGARGHSFTSSKIKSTKNYSTTNVEIDLAGSLEMIDLPSNQSFKF
jgi:hypothetical protein